MRYSCVPLGGLVTISGGGTPSRNNDAYWGGSIPWATVKDLKDTSLSGTQETITPEGLRDSASNLIPAGSVIVATRMGLGKVAINTIDVAINQDLKAFSCCADIEPRYLMYFLLANASHLDSMGKGATVKGITLDVLKDLSVPLPPLPEQKRIAAILDKADSIRRKRQESVRLTEELLRSVFLDMFGDPVTNPKGWETGNIDTVLLNPKTDLRCGPFGTQLKVNELVNAGIPLFGIESVRNGKFQNKTSKFLTARKAAELGSFDTKPGDVLVTRMGTIGEACVVPEGVGEARISYHLFRIRPDRIKCLPEFLAATIFQSGTFLMQLKNMAHGAIMDGLSTSNLREVILLIPPIAEQKRYVNLVKKVETQMEFQKKSVITSDTLFNSLLQRAFNGELLQSSDVN